jgi:hypothetical protein
MGGRGHRESLWWKYFAFMFENRTKSTEIVLRRGERGTGKRRRVLI